MCALTFVVQYVLTAVESCIVFVFKHFYQIVISVVTSVYSCWHVYLTYQLLYILCDNINNTEALFRFRCTSMVSERVFRDVLFLRHFAKF